MYGKIFASMYDGSLGGDWKALVAFQQLIVLADRDGVVDMTPRAIAARTGIPIELIEEGIAGLEKPDPLSRTPDCQGRRIERLDDHRPWGWRLVNYGKYRELINSEQKRAADRERIAAKRAAERDTSRSVAVCRKPSRAVANVAQVEVQVEVEEEERREGEHARGSVKSAERAKPPHARRTRRPPETFRVDSDLTNFLSETFTNVPKDALHTWTDKQIARFKDHEFSSPRGDWCATFRNWVRKAIDLGDLPAGASSETFNVEKHQQDVLKTAEVLNLTRSPEESWADFETRVTAANNRRLDRLRQRTAGAV